MVSYSDLDSYVNWHGLETALNGLKDQFNTSAASNLNETVQSYTQTVNIIQYNKKFFSHFIFSQSPIPLKTNEFNMSKELQDLLAKLGTLDTRHEQLKDEVNQLKFELNKKEEPI